MNALAVDGVTVSLDGTEILHGISASLKAGEMLGLVGANGAGKSTLLRAMSGLLKPDAGAVFRDGTSMASHDRRALARQIAYLPQDPVVHWQMSVRDVVALGRLPHHAPWGRTRSDDARAVERALAATDMLAFAERSVRSLSGGERMRVLLARALAGETPVLLADEPVAALDPQHQLQVMEILRQRADAGSAIAIVLHDLNLAMRFCDRLLLLKQGRILAEGRPDEVLDERNLATAFAIEALRGRQDGLPYLLPWKRLKGKSE